MKIGKSKKIAASLMLSTALLPILNGKAATSSASHSQLAAVTQTTTGSAASSLAVLSGSTTTTATSAETPTSAAAATSAAVTSSVTAPAAVATSGTSEKTVPTTRLGETRATASTVGTAQATGSAKTSSVTGANDTITVDAPSMVASQAPSTTASQAVSASSTATSSQAVSSAATSSTATSSTVASSAATKPATSQSAPKAASQVPAVKAAPTTTNQTFGPGYYDQQHAMARSIGVGQQEFLNSIKAGALSGWHKYRVLPSITAAQAILESGWGRSQLATIGNNLFGIKGSYQGQSVYFPTQEWNGSQYITIQDAFRKYPNWSASVEDHGAFLDDNPRYGNLLGKTDYHQVASLLQQDGYATAPTYASYLINIIDENQLDAWDREVLAGTSNPGQTTKPNGNVTAASGQYTFNQATAIHSAADQNSSVVGTYEAGDTVRYNAKVTVGTQTWLQYLAYSGATHYVMISDQSAVTDQVVPASGSFKFKEKTNIRVAASKTAKIVGQYDAGNTVYYNGKVTANGITWLRYLSYSGTVHYVATSGDAVAPVARPNVVSANGAYHFTSPTAIKAAPADNAANVGTYNAGETVYYNAKVTVDGATWLRYQSYSGAQHYVKIAGTTAGTTSKPTQVTPATGSYRFNRTTIIKNGPSNGAASVGTYYAGDTVYYNAKVQADGQTWLRYQSYSGVAHYVAISGTSNSGGNSNSAANVTAKNGAFRFSTTTNIRTAPSTHAAIVGEYYVGDTVYYNGTVRADGYTWLRYVSRSGAIHYVAVVR